MAEGVPTNNQRRRRSGPCLLDSPEIYQNIKHIIQENDLDFTMVTGAFHLVQDPLMDYHNYKHVNNPAARREVLRMIQKFSLVNPWRIANEQIRKLT